MSRRANKAAHAVLFQRRVLTIISGISICGFILWIVAIATDYWTFVDGVDGIYIEEQNRYFLQSHSGLWKSCETLYSNETRPAFIIDRCSYINFFPSEPSKVLFAHYQRTMGAFAIVTILIKIMGFMFSMYTFFQTRYMYKRLAAASNLISAGCCLVVLEMSATAYDFAAIKMVLRNPPGSEWRYGYSYALAWASFVVDLIAGMTFAIYSMKKKTDIGVVDEENTFIRR